ncbi:hypothetical protein G9A89_016690 [Geosiphon pyriformis]|nr:hypothetical protein G9A89_016690 [Geosiphon pyriformis]
MALLCFLFQLLPGCIGLKSVSRNAVKLFCVEFASQESLNSATKVAIDDEVFLTTFKIAWSSGVISVSSPPLSIALHNVPLGIFFDNIKSALGIFGVVTSVKLKPAGLWQYAVVYFKNTSFAAAVLTNWSVLVKKDSVRIFLLVNQKEIITSRDVFKAKLVNLPFGCTVFEISNLVFQVVVPPPPITTLLLSVALSAIDNAVNARLAFLESHLGELFLLIKSLVEPDGTLVVLVTKLLSTQSAVDVSVKESVVGLAKQNKDLAAIAMVIQKRITCLKKKCEQAYLEDVSDNDDIDDNNDDIDDNNVDNVEDKNFSVYDNTFDVMINKLPLAASDSFSSPLAGSSFSVKVSFKRHTRVSPSVVSTTSKSPKIFNNRPVNKLVFPAFITFTTTTTTTALQMATKAKNSKKQQQAVTTAMVTLNSFVILDEILDKISIATASPLLDMDSNSSGTSPKIGQNQLLAVLPDVLLPGCIGLKSVSQDAIKLFCVEFASQKSLTGVTKVVIGNEIFLTTFKIAWSSGMASVSSLSLLVALCNVPLNTSSNDIKTALGIFGVVTSIKLKPAGLWQYVVVYFKDTSSAATALFHWFVLVRKDSVKIFPIANQKEIISSRDTFKAKLVNLPFGCTAFEISDLVFQVDDLFSNFSGGPKVFKSLFAGSKSYAKTAAFVVPFIAAAANANLDLGVEPVSVLVVLVTKLLSTLFAVDVSVKEYVDGLAKQNKGLAVVITVMQKRLTHLKTISEWICLENRSDVDDMVDNIDDDDDDDKNFSVYDNTFNIMMHL